MEIPLSVSVMAHISREKFFPYLKEKLGDVPFSIDRENKGPWENSKRAWAMHDPKAKYHAVIQDDAIIGRNFYAETAAILGNFDHDRLAYSFYFGRREDTKEKAERGLQEGFIISKHLNWGVAICLPTKIIPQMLEYCERFTIKNDDTRIAGFLKMNDIKIFYPIPSLVDHRDGDSLVGDPGKHRKAWFFIGEDENKSKAEK